MHRNSKAQSAIEFVSTYAFVFLIIAIVIFLLFAFSSIPTKTLPFQCSAFSGFSCVDVLYQTAGNSVLEISLTDAQPAVISIGSFNAKINNFAVIGTCSPTEVLPGNTITCIAPFPFKAGIGTIYTGIFNVTANYCANGVGNISNTTCKSGNSFSFAGSFTTQAQAPTLPQYVAQFNGASSYINIPVTPSLAITQGLTVSFWLQTNAYSGSTVAPMQQTNANGQNSCGGWAFFLYYGGDTNIRFGQRCVTAGSPPGVQITPGVWYHVVGVSTASATYEYINGQQYTSAGALTYNTAGPIYIGAGSEGSLFNGKMANVQMYNIALSPTQVLELYDEGISGTPINKANSVGWWMLNNNPNDASGIGNNGIATSLTYNSNWNTGYTAP